MLGAIDPPFELFAGDVRRPLDNRPPEAEHSLELMLERGIDQLVHDPLDVVTLEDENDLARREIDIVSEKANFSQIEGRALSDQLSSPRLAPLLETRDDRYAFHR
jgi:hypothetical protein